MIDRRPLARQAISAAMRTRKAGGLNLDQAICVYDLAERLGIEIRFLDLPSFEGMYCGSANPAIIISSLRPSGRRAYKCGHELGHHVLGHGVRIDELVDQKEQRRFDPHEFMADCFAGALLMPKMAVMRALVRRGWIIEECTPAQAYAISCYFGVGYATLIHHMHRALQIISSERAKSFMKVKPRQAQALLLGWETNQPVQVVDTAWDGRPVDVEVGDLFFVFADACSEGKYIELVSTTESGRLFRATNPGIGRLANNDWWTLFVRVSRRDFVGRSICRHWEEVTDG